MIKTREEQIRDYLIELYEKSYDDYDAISDKNCYMAGCYAGVYETCNELLDEFFPEWRKIK